MEASKASHDTLSASLAEKEDKLSRIIKTARALKTKNEALKTDKDSVDKEFEETKGDTLTLFLLIYAFLYSLLNYSCTLSKCLSTGIS